MPVPDFQSLMLPVLQIAGDNQLHRLGEAVTQIADQFNLTEEERFELLSSRTQTRIYANVSWAVTYLRNAGLLESPARGVFRITPVGLNTLKKDVPRIDIQYLRQFPEFVEFLGRTRKGTDQQPQPHQQMPQEDNPIEVLESSYLSLRQALAQDVLERVKQCSPRFFELLVIDLLIAMGYGGSREDAGKALGRSGDEGVDGLIKGDVLGLDEVYIQAKRWRDTVGRPTVQAFAGSLEGLRAKRGVLITTSQFSTDARDYVGRIEKKVVLIDGEQLAQFMIDFNVGVTEESRYVIKRIDNDYFEDSYIP